MIVGIADGDNCRTRGGAMAKQRVKSDSVSVAGMMAAGVAVLIFAYLAPFVAILVDEVVLQTGWEAVAPGWMIDALRTIYWPLIELTKNFL